MKKCLAALMLCALLWICCGDTETLDTEAPQVLIVSPADGGCVTDTVNISALATDNEDIDRVEFFIDDSCEASIESAAATYEWDCSSLLDSSEHTIFVTAYDLSENSGSSPEITVKVSHSG